LSTRLKRNLGMLFATAVFLVAALAALPGEAEAQSASTAQDIPTQDARNTNLDAGAAPDQQTAMRAVEPGDTLWAIAQERLGPNASSGLIGQEVGRIFELNREWIGDNPDLIRPGQELLLTERTEPAPDASADVSASDPTATTAAQGPGTAEQPTEAEATPEPNDATAAAKPSSTDSSSTANSEPAYPEAGSAERDAPYASTSLLGWGLLLFSFAAAFFFAWKLYRTFGTFGASRETPASRYRSAYQRDDHNLPLYPQQEADYPAADVPTGDAPTADAPEPAFAVWRNSNMRTRVRRRVR
jgi:LysM repeat protein